MLNITASELRSLCIKHEWFTCGNNDQYEKLFQALESGCSLDKVADIIALCTDDMWNSTSIADTLRKYEAAKAGCEESDSILPIVGNVEMTAYNVDKIEFAKTVPFDECFERIRSFVKIKCDFARPEISTTRNGSVLISFESGDITDQTGAFAPILRRCFLHTFGSSVTVNKETGEMLYWARVDIRYEHHDGGSNGMDVISAQYTKRTGWVFRVAGER